jgi:hypothetical protein
LLTVFLAAVFLATAFLVAGFAAVVAFFELFFVAGAGVESAAALTAVSGFFSATVTTMCASLRW